jgi:tetratricopeptide (TPR) repeat protein
MSFFRIVCLLGGLVFALGCGGDDSVERDALVALVDAGEYEQVLEQAAELRAGGKIAPWLDRCEGVANFHLGREQLARKQLRDAVENDPDLAPEVAALWAEAAREDYREGYRDRARERMAVAVLIDPSTHPGPMLPAVADYMYRFLKNFDAAAPLYEQLYRERPDPKSRHPEWFYRWGHLLEKRGDLDQALAVWDDFFETFPNEMKQARFVTWRYINVLIRQAEEASAAGDPDAALALIKRTKLGGWHLDQQQKAELVAGEICEEHGQFDEARVRYERVLEFKTPIETTFPDDARARLEALDARAKN